LETICLKCLEKEPAKRYDSAAALADDLECWSRGEPILARPGGAAERAMKWARRRPAIAALSGAIVVVAVAGLTGVLSQWQQAETARQEASDRADAEEMARKDADAARLSEKKRADAEARALAQAQQSLYFQRIALARQAWLANDITGAWERLEECPPE